jgi:hypothetical protein
LEYTLGMHSHGQSQGCLDIGKRECRPSVLCRPKDMHWESYTVAAALSTAFHLETCRIGEGRELVRFLLYHYLLAANWNRLTKAILSTDNGHAGFLSNKTWNLT